MEEKILNCVAEAIFEELGWGLGIAVIDRISFILKREKIPFELVEDEETLEFFPRQITDLLC